MQHNIFSQLKLLPTPTGDNFYTACHAGHATHEGLLTEVSLRGKLPIPDMPPVPRHLQTSFTMEVYDWRKYFKTVAGNETVPLVEEYCTGQDIISYCIHRQGIWEGYETLLVLDILKQAKPGVVLDFGAHIGWYTLLAALAGYEVAAIDASAENLQLLKANAKRNHVQDKVHTYLGWLDDKAPTLPGDENVALLKADVEGAENIVEAMCSELFRLRKIEYAIFEISPVFADYYPGMVKKIASYGYKVYQIPGKGWAHTKAFANQPLKTVTAYCEIPLSRHYIQSLSQENFLFVREGKA